MLMVVKCTGLLILKKNDIDKTSDWCKMNKMAINTKKCKIMRITRKKSPLVGEWSITLEVNLWDVLMFKKFRIVYC